MQFDKGYLSPYFVTDTERMEAVLEDAYVLIHQGKISADRRPAAAAGEGRAGGQAAAHRGRGRRRRGALDARRQQDPRHVQRRRPSRRRASATAARRCCRTSRSSPAARSSRRRSASSSTRSASTCSARPAASSSPRTTPRSSTAPANGPRSRAGSRQIKAEIERTDSDWDREKLQERLAKLAGGVCVIKVGAHTEVELKEKKHRIEDAISATRAAIEEGIVAGGGTALIHAASVLDDSLGLAGDEAPASAIVRKAAAEPLRWIAENAGLQGYVVVEQGARAPTRAGPQRGHRRVRRPDRGRRHRPGQGDPVGAAQRRVDRVDGATTDTLVVEKKESRARRLRPATATATATDLGH